MVIHNLIRLPLFSTGAGRCKTAAGPHTIKSQIGIFLPWSGCSLKRKEALTEEPCPSGMISAKRTVFGRQRSFRQRGHSSGRELPNVTILKLLRVATSKLSSTFLSALGNEQPELTGAHIHET
jgi:hypothetical protein